MAAPEITPLPDPPHINDPANFASKASAFVGALPGFRNDLMALADYIDEVSFVGGPVTIDGDDLLVTGGVTAGGRMVADGNLTLSGGGSAGSGSIDSASFIDINPGVAPGIRVGRKTGSFSRITLLEPGTTTGRIILNAMDGGGTVSAGGPGTFGGVVVGTSSSNSLSSGASPLDLHTTASGGVRIGRLAGSVSRLAVLDPGTTNGLVILDSAGGSGSGSVQVGGDPASGDGIILRGGGLYDARRAGNCMALNRQGAGDGTIASFAHSGTGVASVSVTPTGGTFNTTCDGNLKEDFRDFDSGALIDAMTMYDFAWKGRGVRGFGPKAQELHPVFPAGVIPGRGTPQSPDFEPWMWSGNPYIALLIREMQSVRQRLSAVDVRLAALEAA